METYGVENGSSNRNVDSTFLFDIYTRYLPILHRLATVHNAVDRQTTDRAIGIGRICSSIGGLIIDYSRMNYCKLQNHLALLAYILNLLLYLSSDTEHVRDKMILDISSFLKLSF